MTTGTATRRQIVLLGVLVIVLAGAIMYAMGLGPWSGPAIPGAVATAATGPVRTPLAPVADVRLEKLAADGIGPAESGRNPFRMGAATPPPAAGGPSTAAGTRPAAVPTGPPVPVGPPPPPPVPPIPFKFIGILSGPGGIGRIAVLSDGKTVVHGRENDIVDGRYRIVRIAEESLQIEHVDGRGRQTLRLSGA